jgi:uncharacterized SAM-binding protein YcdF (DUF218 family)
MFFDKILSLLIYPLGLSILLGIAGLLLMVWRCRRFAGVVLSCSICGLTLWSLPPVADAVARSLEAQFANLAVDAVQKADVILVFGGVMQPPQPGRPYADLGAAADRVWHAARLYHAGKAPKVMLSGGSNDWQADLPSQAKTMAQFLSDLGVPLNAIVLEERSRSTYENASNCAELMRRQGMERAILVTSALHMPRSFAVLRVAGVDVVPAATDFEVIEGPGTVLSWLPNSQALQRSTNALHEWIGIAVYRWRGWM